MKLSIIFSTYNSPNWLEKVLWGFYYQTFKDFELIIADDGSTDETKQRIENFTSESGMPITHIWQEDEGFQKTKILNKAVVASNNEYLVFTDGDCIPRKDFLAVHHQHIEPGCFLSGGYLKLPMQTSLAIEREHIESGQAFDRDWLIRHGMKRSHKLKKLTTNKLKQQLLNALAPTKARWYGHNASAWRKDLIAVNGFDERMQYGGEDLEFGYRLANSGIKGKQIRYSAVCVHLDHARGYVEPEMIAKNDAIQAHSIAQKIVKTPYGICKE